MCLLESLQPVLGGALCAPNALAVRVACLNAVESMVEHVTDKEHRAHQQALQAHLPACLAVLQEALASGNMTHAKECLTSFIAIAKWAPRPPESQAQLGWLVAPKAHKRPITDSFSPPIWPMARANSKPHTV